MLFRSMARLATNPKAEQQWNEKAAAFELKTTRCQERMGAINCNMITGSAKLFAENGESGGETISCDSLERLHPNSDESHHQAVVEDRYTNGWKMVGNSEKSKEIISFRWET